MPTVTVPALPLPVFATVIEGVGDLDQFASTVRELDEREDAQLDEEATRTLLDFARSLRLASVRLMTDARKSLSDFSEERSLRADEGGEDDD